MITTNMIPWLDMLGLLMFIIGYTVGLGAGGGMALHFVLNEKFDHWVNLVLTAHKTSEPLIWSGLLTAFIGGAIYYRDSSINGVVFWHMALLALLVISNLLLRYRAIPFYAAKREIKPPMSMQIKIMVSVFISATCWPGELLLMVWSLFVP